MEVYCGACHEDVEHATRYKNKDHIVACDIFSFTLHCSKSMKVKVHATWICRIDWKGLLDVLTIDPK